MAGRKQDLHIAVESTPKRAFATALDWPGWSRGGKNREVALEALRASAPRYAKVAAIAGLAFDPQARADVVRAVAGSAYTEFGVPGAEFDLDRMPVSKDEMERTIALVQAAWTAYDQAAKTGTTDLRKGPRGGGRDRNKIAAHLLEAERAYAGPLGLKLNPTDPDDRAGVLALRRQIVDALRDAASRPAPKPAAKPKRWTFRYAARRIAWHVLDHAWEIEDRATTVAQPEKS